MKINEKLGVPEGIVDEGTRIYREIVESLENLKDSDFGDAKVGESKEIKLGEWDIKFADFEIKKLPIFLVIKFVDVVPLSTLMGASYANLSTIGTKSKKIGYFNEIEKSSLLINIATNPESPLVKSIAKDIKNCIKGELKSSTITHELHHMYSGYKGKFTQSKRSSNYSSYQIFGNMPRIISDFLFLLYFMTTIENTVRSSEMLTKIKELGIKKSEFSNWIEGTDIMKNINEAKNFKIEKFMEDLRKDNEVRSMVSDYNPDSSDVAKDAMRIIFSNISNLGLQTSTQIIGNYFNKSMSEMGTQSGFGRLFSVLFGVEDKRVNDLKKLCNSEFNKTVNFYKKWDGREEKYFEFLQKRLNFAGDKMKKKLYKLWSMVNESNNSIMNWDLWNKINSDKKLETSVDFDKIKTDFNNKLK